MKRSGVKLAGLGLAAAVITGGAAPAGLEDPEATVASELVVRAVIPGPAWWTVQRGSSVVYILGMPDQPIPKTLAWDQSALQRRLQGASALIVPDVGTAGLGDIPALLRMRLRLKSKTPMEQGLPEGLRIRFAAARMRLGKPASRYAGWNSIVAGQFLVGDFYDGAEATNRQPMDAIRRQAGHAHVPIRPAASFRVMRLLDPAVRNLTPEISQSCLTGALDEVDAGAHSLDGAAAAWARGDLPAMLARPRGFAACLLLIQGGASFWRQTITDEADAVAAATAKSGHAVAIFPIRSLVAENGILGRLKAQGFEVTGGRTS
jgi:hypothetical protein